jgi:PAS domain S-box-containing protein
VTTYNQCVVGRRIQAVRSALFRYGFAVIATTAVLLLKWTLGRMLGEEPPFLLFQFSVLSSAWYGGFGPGMFSAVLACISVELPLLLTDHSLALSSFILVRMGIFFPESALISWVIAPHREVLARLSALVKCSDDAIIGATSDGMITTWNSGAEQIYGYSASEVIGRPFTILVPPELVREAQEMKARAERGEHIRRFETVRMRKDGTRVDVSITVSPIKDFTGKLIGASAVARDITERKRAERTLRESEERFRVMADTAPVMIWMGDGAGNNTFCNKYLLEFTGRTQDQQLGKAWIDDIHPKDRQRCWNTVQAAQGKRQAYTVEYRFRRGDGEYRWVLETGVPRLTAGGEFIGYVGSCIDITERKWAELAVRGSRDELECQVSEQSAELAEATSRLIREITKREHAEDLLRDPGHSN